MRATFGRMQEWIFQGAMCLGRIREMLRMPPTTVAGISGKLREIANVAAVIEARTPQTDGVLSQQDPLGK